VPAASAAARTAVVDGTLVLTKDRRRRFCVDSAAASYIFIFAMRRYRACRVCWGNRLKLLSFGRLIIGNTSAEQQLYFDGIAAPSFMMIPA
jgi:hypothetical protein